MAHEIDEQTRERFYSLSAKWQQQSRHRANGGSGILHEQFQELIDLGPTVIPLIFIEYAKNSGFWYLLLDAITNENPITEEHRGRHIEMREDWFDWGRKHGYIDPGTDLLPDELL